MGKTIKRHYSWWSYYRCPRGRKQALIHGARSIPPSSHDDIDTDRHNWIPFRAAENMVRDGLDYEIIIKKLRKKFKLSYKAALQIFKWSNRNNNY